MKFTRLGLSHIISASDISGGAGIAHSSKASLNNMRHVLHVKSQFA